MLLKLLVSISCRLECQDMPDRQVVCGQNAKHQGLCCLKVVNCENTQKPKSCRNSSCMTGSTWEHLQAKDDSSAVQTTVDLAQYQAALCCGCTASVVCSSFACCKYCLLKWTLPTQLFSAFWPVLKFLCVALQEMVENMDSTRDVWAMQLDTIRNRIIRVELLVAVASFSLMMSTVPASFFGMNLTSGLEVIPNSHLVVSMIISFHEVKS